MPQSARLGDPISHGGEIITGSPNVLVNGLAKARIGDSVDCEEHGVNPIVSGSPDVLTNASGAARVGDTTDCGASITAGSPNVFIDDGAGGGGGDDGPPDPPGPP